MATAFARIVCQEIFSLDLTKWMAFFLLYQTKLSGYGCGGGTEQFALPRLLPRRMTVYDEATIAERVERAMGLCLLDSVNPSVSREQLAERVDDLKAVLDQVKTATQEPDWAPFIMEEMRKLKAGDSTGNKSQ